MLRSILFSCIWIALSLCPTLSRATVINVPADQPSIQAAIDAAASGDTILVAAGVYSEHLAVNGKEVHILSTDGPDVTVLTYVANGISLVTYQTTGGISGTIKGFTFLGGGTSIGAGGALRVSSGNNIRIVDNLFLSNVSGNGAAIYVNSCEIVMRDNRFRYNTGGACVVIIVSPSITIENNTFIRNDGGPAIYAYSCVGRIAGNTLSRNYRGIAIDNSAVGCIIKNNIVAWSSLEGIINWAQPTFPDSVDYNDVYANGGLGDHFGLVPGPNTLTSNPLFCDTSLSNYHLASNSPCIGAGEGGVNIGALGVGCTEAAPEQPEIDVLVVGYPGDPMHVTASNPTIAWDYFDPQGRAQTQFEIEFGTDNSWTVAELWQPGAMNGSDTSIVYAGAALSDGQTYYCRLRVYNDTLWSFWTTVSFRMNSKPTAPTIVSPANDAFVLTATPQLRINNASDAEGDALRYDFEVHDDSTFTGLLAYAAGVFSGVGQTVWTSDALPDNTRVWWRCRASDGFENGSWSVGTSFWVDAVPQAPSAAQLISPANGGGAQPTAVTFVWHPSADPDPFDTVSYRLQLGLDAGFSFSASFNGILDTTFAYPDSLVFGNDYYWRVFAFDTRTSDSSVSATYQFFAGRSGDVNGDGNINASDIIFLVNFVFKGGPPPVPVSLGDVNASCAVNAADIIYLVNYVFKGGPAPLAGC